MCSTSIWENSLQGNNLEWASVIDFFFWVLSWAWVEQEISVVKFKIVWVIWFMRKQP